MGTMKNKDDRSGGAAGPSPELTFRSDSGQSGASDKAASGQAEGRANVTLRQRAEEELQESKEHLKFESLLAEFSSEFINLSADKVDRQVEDAQRRICECLGLDLSSLWQRSAESPGDLVLTHVYCPPDMQRPPVMKAGEAFPWCLQQVLAGRVIAVSLVEETPTEAARDKEVWRQLGIKTTLTIPLSTGEGPTIGALSFNTIWSERTWPDTLVKRLQLVRKSLPTRWLANSPSTRSWRASRD